MQSGKLDRTTDSYSPRLLNGLSWNIRVRILRDRFTLVHRKTRSLAILLPEFSRPEVTRYRPISTLTIRDAKLRRWHMDTSFSESQNRLARLTNSLEGSIQSRRLLWRSMRTRDA